MNSNISRRSLLKLMGMGAAAVATTGVASTLQACAPKGGKSRLVFYFSATGNSLWAARQLAGEQGEALSIPQELKLENLDYEASEIGIVFPKFPDVPAIVQDWIRRATFKCDYLFAVITCGRGINQEVVDSLTDKLKDKAKLDYVQLLKMADNRFMFMDMAQELKNYDDKQINADLAAIAADVAAHKQQFPANLESGRNHPHPVQTADERFAVTDACIGCGICVDVCPRGDFRVVDDMAQCAGMCEECLACVHNCPQHAIKGKMGDRIADKNPKARYRNPHVSLRQIQAANRANEVMSPKV